MPFEQRILRGNTIGNRLRILPKHEPGEGKKAQQAQGESDSLKAYQKQAGVKESLVLPNPHVSLFIHAIRDSLLLF
jgi:hypothetical protein